MRRFSLGSRLAVLVPLIALVTGLSQVRAADAIPSERRLGNDVVAFFSIHNISELKTAWEKTQLGQLVKDKELAPFLAQFEGQWTKLTEQFESEVGLPLTSVLNIPHGEFSLAVVHTAGKQMGVVAFMDFGDQREAVDKLIEKATTAIEAEGRTKRTEENVDGTEVVIYEMEVADADGDADENATKKPKNPNGLAYFLKDTHLVVGSRMDIMKAVLTRWDGQHERIFADKLAFKHIKERCRGENAEVASQMIWYVDPIGLFKGGLAMANAGPTETGIALGFLPSLGLDKVKGFGGTLDMGTDNFDMVTRTLIYLDNPPSGVLNAFQFPKKNQTPPKWVEADVSTYAALNWDLAETYNTVETLYETFLGAGSFGKVIDELAEQEDGPKIHIKNDIVDHLTGGIVFVGRVPEQADLAVGERYLIGLELKDEAPVKKILDKLADLEGFPGTVRDFEGEKILEFSEEDADEEAMTPFKLGMAVTKQHFFFATHVAELESLLRSNADRESLADSEAYKIIAKQFPDQTSSLGFQRSDAQLKMLYDALKSGALTEALDQDDFQLDTSTLPEFEVLKKYFKPSGGYMVPDEKGWFMLSFSLKSDAAN